VAWHLPVTHRRFDRMPASVWIRALQLLPYLERLGVRSVINDEDAPADIAVFVRRQDEASLRLAERLRARGVRVALDLCVNYYDETGLLPGGYGVTREHVSECLAMTAVADVVLAASRFIAERARAHHARVELLPDSVDRAHFRFVKTFEPPARWWRRARPPVAVWCGTAVKAAELEPWIALLAKRDIPLLIISDRRPRLSARFRFVRWRHASIPRDLLRGDFSIAPRELDTPYNRGHSAFKIGMFMAEGVPAVASPVPSYREVLVPEEGGLICDTPAEWEEALDRIVAAPALLARWSPGARRAMEPYLTEAVARDYARVFAALAAARR
jgi:glycosyltransferase involved in cell wall biosynthesis